MHIIILRAIIAMLYLIVIILHYIVTNFWRVSLSIFIFMSLDYNLVMLSILIIHVGAYVVQQLI